jgi:hypothetical protein
MHVDERPWTPPSRPGSAGVRGSSPLSSTPLTWPFSLPEGGLRLSMVRVWRPLPAGVSSMAVGHRSARPGRRRRWRARRTPPRARRPGDDVIAGSGEDDEHEDDCDAGRPTGTRGRRRRCTAHPGPARARADPRPSTHMPRVTNAPPASTPRALFTRNFPRHIEAVNETPGQVALSPVPCGSYWMTIPAAPYRSPRDARRTRVRALGQLVARRRRHPTSPASTVATPAATAPWFRDAHNWGSRAIVRAPKMPCMPKFRP